MKIHWTRINTNSMRGIAVVLLIAMAIALGIRFFLFRPYSVSGRSMERTLLDGDHLLCNVWIYGWKIGPLHTPRWARPKPGNMILFERPNAARSPALRRCVAVSGQTVEIFDKRIFVDGRPHVFPRSAKASELLHVGRELALRDEMPRIRIPRKGDTIDLAEMHGFDLDFLVSLIRQENPGKTVRLQCRLLIGQIDRSDLILEGYAMARGRFDQLPFDTMTWLDYQRVRLFLQQKYPGEDIEFRRRVELDGKPLMRYAVKAQCCFVMSDRWDAYDDSRLWGYVSDYSLLGRPSIIFFSAARNVRKFPALRLGRIGRIVW